MDFIEVLKVILLGVVEGFTEWLPISSTGHMILVDQVIHLNVSAEFMEMFRVVIQLGAILAVVVMYFDRLWPFGRHKSVVRKRETVQLWLRVIVGCIPAGVLGVLFNDWFEAHFYNSFVVAGALILYGVLFILLENRNKRVSFKINQMGELTYRTALLIGLFQVLSLVPGTSRSGSTILGAMLLGCSRGVSAEFSFFMAIPVMFGASGLKLLKFGMNFSGQEIAILLLGMAVAFVVSVYAIKLLMGYIRTNDFKFFGYYRIVLGIAVIVYFMVSGAPVIPG